jgi:hypothetical protein
MTEQVKCSFDGPFRLELGKVEVEGEATIYYVATFHYTKDCEGHLIHSSEDEEEVRESLAILRYALQVAGYRQVDPRTLNSRLN